MFKRPAHTWHYEPVFVLSHAGEVFGYSSCFLCVPGCFLKCLVGGIFFAGVLNQHPLRLRHYSNRNCCRSHNRSHSCSRIDCY